MSHPSKLSITRAFYSIVFQSVYYPFTNLALISLNDGASHPQVNLFLDVLTFIFTSFQVYLAAILIRDFSEDWFGIIRCWDAHRC